MFSFIKQSLAHLKKRWSLVAILFATFVLPLAFHNCTKARLYTENGSMVATATGSFVSKLPPPVTKPARFRLMVFVDQSHSMKYLKCATDLDGTNPSPIGPDCPVQNGSDPQMNRYSAIDNWLSSIEQLAAGSTDAETYKVALIPFSGGKKARPNNRPTTPTDQQIFKYLGLSDARLAYAKLKKEQQDEPHYGGDVKVMGTTAPFETLQKAQGIFQSEVDLLESRDELTKSIFEFVYVSDGVFKPLQEYLQIALRLANCPTDCGYNDDRPACYGGPDNGWEGTSPYEYCNTVIPQLFSTAYGNYNENTVDQIANLLRSIATYHLKYNDGGRVNVHLVRFPDSSVPVEDRPTPSPNLFDSIYDKLKDLKNVSINTLDSAIPPFSIQPRLGGTLSYRIRQFYAINLNAFGDEFGNLVADSDGDGVGDADELVNNLDPANPRSNGRCLDSITKLYQCNGHRSCEPNMDNDADGLNDCDESILGSNANASDTDNDTFFDFFEVARGGLSVNKDERNSNKSGDIYNDHQHFLMGVHPMVRVASVRPEFRIETEVKMISEDRVNVGGIVSVTPTYEINIKNMPLVNTVAVSSVVPMKYNKKNQINPIPLTDTLGPTNHGANINQLVFLVQVAAIEAPDTVYWLIYRKDLNVEEALGAKVQLHLNLADFHQLMLLQ